MNKASKDFNAACSFDISRCLVCGARDLNACGVLEPGELSRLASMARCESYRASQPLFHEGDAADWFYNITDGAIRLTRNLQNGRRQVIGFMFPGDFLGFTGDGIYPYNAEAVRGAKVCRFARDDYDKAVRELPKMGQRMLEMASGDLVSAQEHVTMLGQQSATEKVISFLLMLSRKAERRGSKSNPVQLPMTREDIADYLGLAFETVSRCLTRLEEQGLIALESPRVVQIQDFQALEDYTEES